MNLTHEQLKAEGLRSLRHRLNRLNDVRFSDAVHKAILAERARRAPDIAKVQAAIDELEKCKRPVAPRFPADLPGSVLTACDRYWKGTEEFYKYRVHLWNARAVWTSYPSGGYSTNGGWIKSPACYHLLSLLENDSHGKPKVLKTVDGRQKPSELQQWLDAV